MNWNPWRTTARPIPMVFRWRKGHGLSFRLVFFLFTSLVVHLAAFYFFEVVYPPNRKDLIRDASLWLLPAGDPAAQAVLAAHEPALRVYSGGTPCDPEAGLPQVKPRFSSDAHDPELLPWPEITDRTPAKPTGLPDVEWPPLAAGPRADAPAAPAVPASGLVWLEAETDRLPLPPRILGMQPPRDAEGGVWEFQVAYAADRVIREVVVQLGSGTEWDARLRRGLFGLTVPDSLPAPKGNQLRWTSLQIRF